MSEIISLDTGQESTQQPIERETFAAYIQIVGPVFYNNALTKDAKLLYGLLAAMTQPPRYYAFPRNRTLMKYLDCSERSLQRTLAELKDAGELTIENGEGGRQIRKIRLTRLQPIYPVTDDGGTPAKNDGGNKNNRNRKKCRGKASSTTQEEIIQWFNLWVAKQDLNEKDSTDLCTDLRDFAENRESMGKPFNTIKAAARMGNRLLALSEGATHRVGMMRYLISKSIRNNWSDIFELKEKDMDDYRRFLAAEYGIGPSTDNVDYF